MKHVFVFDPKAFFGQQWKMDNILDSIGQFFRTQENPDFSIQFSRYRRNAITIVQDESVMAAPGSVVRIYAIGGEEILFDCLNAVAHFPDMQLAVIPYGEKCDFLTLFGKENEEAFRDIPTLINGRPLPTDIIKWGVNYAINSCYIGMNSSISKNIKDMRANLQKGSFIVLSRISSFVNNILTSFDKESAARKYKITVDNADYSGSYSLIHIANGPCYNGRITGASDATPDDGLLNVALIRASHPLKTLLSIRRYFRGKRPSNCTLIKGKKITVKSDNQMWVQLDNEYIQDTSIELSLVQHSVQMVAVNNLSYPLPSIPSV